MNLLLIGLRGSGKSTIGPMLADALSMRFIELDAITMGAFTSAASVREIWQVHGEPAWRAAEADAFARVVKEDGQVISLGGGSAMIASVQQAIRDAQQAGNAFVAYLRAEPQELFHRFQSASEVDDRPSLTDQPLQREVEIIHAARDPVYRSIADATIEVAGRSPQEVVRMIVEKLGSRKNARQSS